MTGSFKVSGVTVICHENSKAVLHLVSFFNVPSLAVLCTLQLKFSFVWMPLRHPGKSPEVCSSDWQCQNEALFYVVPKCSNLSGVSQLMKIFFFFFFCCKHKCTCCLSLVIPCLFVYGWCFLETSQYFNISIVKGSFVCT